MKDASGHLPPLQGREKWEAEEEGKGFRKDAGDQR